MAEYTEEDIRSAASIELFTLRPDGNSESNRKINVKILGSNDAETWVRDFARPIAAMQLKIVMLANQVDQLTKGIVPKNLKDDKLELTQIADKAYDTLADLHAQQLKEKGLALKGYCSGTFTEQVLSDATVAQLLRAYEELMKYTDPMRAADEYNTALKFQAAREMTKLASTIRK